jgi:hypothetical protein
LVAAPAEVCAAVCGQLRCLPVYKLFSEGERFQLAGDAGEQSVAIPAAITA